MSDDLKKRLQARLQRDRAGRFDPELSTVIGPGIYQDIMEAAARIEQLEAQVDTLQTAMTAPTQDEIDLRSKLASSQAEALAAHAEVIRTQDEIGKLLHHAEAQLAAGREALQSAREYVSTDIDDGVPSERKARRLLKRIDAALATAPATDEEKK